MIFGKQTVDVQQMKINKFISDVKQLKMNKFISDVKQLKMKNLFGNWLLVPRILHLRYPRYVPGADSKN